MCNKQLNLSFSQIYTVIIGYIIQIHHEKVQMYFLQNFLVILISFNIYLIHKLKKAYVINTFW